MAPTEIKKTDIAVLGSGPGGYVAAIRAAQLGKKVIIIEQEKLGGVCLNKGCIPTKALLKAAHSIHEISQFSRYGINVELKSLTPSVAVKRAADISSRISKGVSFLMKKNKIEVIQGRGVLEDPKTLKVDNFKIQADNIIIATGAHYRTFPGLVHDNQRLIGAWEALQIENPPKRIGIVGAGAIGMEFAYFWNSFGVEVHIFEVQSHLLPIEDEDASKELERAYKKYKINFSLNVTDVKAQNVGDHAVVECLEGGEKKRYEFDTILIAVGMTGSIENIGLEKLGIKTEKGFIQINEFCQTNIPNIYAIGDVAGAPLLAHKASHEGIIAVEKIAGLVPHPLNKNNIPSCTYCYPQVASVGLTEKALKQKGAKYSVGMLPFMANGKALASDETDGFVKVMVGEYGELLGASIVGTQATELIHEYNFMREIEAIDEDVFKTVHPHPTLGEWLAEAIMNARGRSINY